MISLVEALNYRCLRHVRQPLASFHVLVGANASGKTTFLDVVAFLGRLVSDGLEAAIHERTRNFDDLLWGRRGVGFELAVEAAIPSQILRRLGDPLYDTVRYEVSVERDQDSSEPHLASERVLLKKKSPPARRQPGLFPFCPAAPPSILSEKAVRGTRTALSKTREGRDNFMPEVEGSRWSHAFKFGQTKSALGNLPADESTFPVSTWLKGLLTDGVQQIVLNSLKIRNASPPGQGRMFKSDGSNLPWVIDNLKQKSSERMRQWIQHLRTALPDIEGIRTVEREDDKHRYLILQYAGGLEVPSWVASDGTLRLLALTLPAYLNDFNGVYLIEEPENGIHPRAIETMYQSLSSVYGAQMLMATHSPVILSIADSDKVLCFAKTEEGATDIVLGSEHPALQDWKGETNLGTLFAGGVLG